MVCENCNKIIDNDSVFCVYCGVKVTNSRNNAIHNENKYTELIIKITSSISKFIYLVIKSILKAVIFLTAAFFIIAILLLITVNSAIILFNNSFYDLRIDSGILERLAVKLIQNANVEIDGSIYELNQTVLSSNDYDFLKKGGITHVEVNDDRTVIYFYTHKTEEKFSMREGYFYLKSPGDFLKIKNQIILVKKIRQTPFYRFSTADYFYKYHTFVYFIKKLKDIENYVYIR